MSQHTTLLGQFSRTSLTEGLNEKLLWHADSTRVVVKVRSLVSPSILTLSQTSEGFLHVYKIERNVGPPLEIPLAKYALRARRCSADARIRGADKILTYLPLRVQEQINITIVQCISGPGRINCVAGDAEHIFAGTASGAVPRH